MPKHAGVVGTAWGDEGKGKIIASLATQGNFGIVARYNGGDNAGHTVVYNGTEYKLHVVPSGIVYDGTFNIIGNGCVLSPRRLFSEIRGLEQQGVEVSPDSLAISSRAHLILPYHVALDSATSKKELGTTGKGIGPAYTDKAARRGVMAGDLLSGDAKSKAEKVIESAIETLIARSMPKDDANQLRSETYKELEEYGTQLRPFITNTSRLLHEKMQTESVLAEGAQGTLLDINHGSYPFVTSSTTTLSGVDAGLGVHLPLARRIGVVKIPMSRVGEGPFPTELGVYDAIKEEKQLKGNEKAATVEALLGRINRGEATDAELGTFFRQKGGEYGTTTGRPRRMGWLDVPLLREAAVLNGLTELVVTKIDVLSGLKQIRICTDYEGTNDVPLKLSEARPKYQSTPGWEEDIFGQTGWDGLPYKTQHFIELIEKMVSTPVTMIGTGPANEHLIQLPDKGLERAIAFAAATGH